MAMTSQQKVNRIVFAKKLFMLFLMQEIIDSIKPKDKIKNVFIGYSKYDDYCVYTDKLSFLSFALSLCTFMVLMGLLDLFNNRCLLCTQN